MHPITQVKPDVHNDIRHLRADQSFDAVIGCFIRNSRKGRKKNLVSLELDHRPPLHFSAPSPTELPCSSRYPPADPSS